MSEPQKNKTLLLILGISALSLAALLYLPDRLKNSDPALITLNSDNNCMLNNASCSTYLDNKTISMEILSSPIRSSEPLDVVVRLENIPADKVMLDLQGRDMYMGINQTELVESKQQPGLWQGKVTLAVCSTGEMIWQANLITTKGQSKHQASFFFSAR